MGLLTSVENWRTFQKFEIGPILFVDYRWIAFYLFILIFGLLFIGQ